jgi:glycosyltransferase involved in cell wall biosynthesis
MSVPRVAVVIPCFDDGATLVETLDSLAHEEAHELVVVDDGSADPATVTTLLEVERTGVAVVRRENGGLSAARMTGVAATTAPYVLPLDADDLLVRGAVAALADALDANPSAMLAWGDIDIFGTFEFTVRTPEHLDPWYLTYLDELPPTPMIRRRALLEAGGWQLEGPYEDWDLWLAFADRGWDGVRIPRTMIRYRRMQPRLSARGLELHGEIAANLRARHPSLYADRRRLRRTTHAPRRAQLLFPLIDRLPVQALDRHRLFRLVAHPVQALRVRRTRRKSERAS